MNRLITLLDDPGTRRARVDQTAAVCLIAFGPKAASATARLVRNLERDDARGREAAARALASIGPAAREAVPALQKRLASAEDPDRLAAATALWRIAGERELVIPVLRQALGSRDGSEQAQAAELLGEMGPHAAVAVPDLVEGLTDPARKVRAACTNALERIDPTGLTRAKGGIRELPTHFSSSAELHLSSSPSRTGYLYSK